MSRTFERGEEQLGTDRNTLELGRIDYLILTSLNNNGATSAILGLTIKELEITDVQRSTVWKHINFLVRNDLVCQSGYYGKQKMYYITKLGIERLGGL